jgi:hypothetical protein
MKARGTGSDWSCGLSSFVDAKELDAMFKSSFGAQDDESSSYRLDVDGASRVYEGLPAAVRIQENDSQMRFSFSWGAEQEVARQLDELAETSPRRLPADSDGYARVLSILVAIRPEIYRGGPDPELAFEEVAHHVFFQNGDVTYGGQGTAYAGLDVVFMKHAVN